MEGIPEGDLKDHEKSKGNEVKTQFNESKPMPVVSTSGAPMIPIPGVVTGQLPGMMSMPSMPFGLPQNSQQFANFAANMGGPPPSHHQMGPFGAAIPPPPSLVGHTIVGAARGLNPGLPNKPLFPSVSSTTTTTQSSVVGSDFRPLGFAHNSGPNNPFMTSNANTNSSNPTVSASAIISKPASSATIATAGASSKIVHPEEDISLEELRARQSKYKLVIPQQKPQQSMNGLNPNAAVYSTPTGPPPPLPPNLGLPPPQGLLGPNPMSAHPSFQPTFRPAF